MEEYVNKAAVLAAIVKANKEAPISYTHEEIIDLMVEYINKLHTEDVNELKEEVHDLNNRRHLIWALGVDYDGCNTVESLKELIDELVSYTQLPREQVPDITSRIGRWVVCGDGDYVPFKCTACGNNTSWYHKQTAKYCPNCGAKMVVDQ
jgi:DNA-directed RNA polymerase subunit RPC12/RpoP/polyhydroxyalkanoate synthesis regulator phasin